MRRWLHVPIFCLYALAALAIAFLLPLRVANVPAQLAWTAGGFIFTLGMLIHLAAAHRLAVIAQRRLQSVLEEVAGRLAAEQQRLALAVERLDGSLAAIEVQAAPDVGNVVAEVKVLQSLVERLYSARAVTSAPAAIKADNKSETPKAAKRGAPALATAVPAQRTSEPARRDVAETASGKPGPAPAAQGDGNGGNSLPMPPVAEGLDERTILDLVRDGLRENGVELALQPIVSLPQRKRRYFECSSPIRVGSDRVLVPEQYIDIAERHGLITAIDNLMLFRCIQMVRRLRRSNTTTGFFLNISHHTLADRDFFQQFINLMSQHVELAPNLIFEFSQRAIESADQALWTDLGRLAQMGFRFSIDQVYSLDIDVADLSSRHFRFLKLEADRLLEAVLAGQMGDDPSALKRILDSYAIDLIVERIEGEGMLRELLDLHLDFGQGNLFGEPRLVRSEMASPLT